MQPNVNPEFVVIPDGDFLMGSEAGQENERPVHRVWLCSFAIGKFPVTNREFKVFVAATGASAPPFHAEPMFADAELPVVGVTWDEAASYCQWLSERSGKICRLPTEAEWERAARGGRDGGLFPWGDTSPEQRPYAGFDPLTGGPARVGVNDANGFGLYDMSEGVHEWCGDFYDYRYYLHSEERNPQGPTSGTRRASRGGSWRHQIKFARCAARSSLPPSFRYADYGFRVAMELT
ncbi:MAG: formylglycine-generating enzyme family protein [Deltaproteobacteria bacterium]|nr:formylglycine-generating enzyme family protein [Deltaproteobacteria bacterium]